MATIRDPRQVWCLVWETLPYGSRYAPAPLPSPPEFGSRAYWDASMEVQRAAWAAYDAEVVALFRALEATCLAAGRAA